MRIRWISHSGFLVEGESASLVFDLYQDPSGVVPDLLRRRRESGEPPRPVFLLVSHQHADHCSPVVLDYVREPGVFLVLEEGAADRLLGDGMRMDVAKPGGKPVRPVLLRPGDVVRLGQDGRTLEALEVDANPGSVLLEVAAFGSTDLGASFRVRLDGRTIFHSGDLNDWYWEEESTPEELVADEAAFERVVETIRAAGDAVGTGPLDVAFLPLDPRLGLLALRGPLRFLRRIPTKFAVPMHLPAGTDLPCGFAREAGGLATVALLDGPGATFTLQEDGPAATGTRR